MKLHLLQEFIQPNLKRLALELQSMLIEADLDGFNCELEGVGVSLGQQSRLVAVKLIVDPAPKSAIVKSGSRSNRFTWTGHEHVIELYDGPTIDLGSDTVNSIDGKSYSRLNAGVYFIAASNRASKSLMLECHERGDVKNLVGFEVGFSQKALEAFAKQYIEGWGT